MISSIVILVVAVAAALGVGFYLGKKASKIEIPTT